MNTSALGGLSVHSARSVMVGISLVASLGGIAAWVRLLPWMFAPDVPWRVVLPFGRLLLASALEIGLLVGAPMGLLSYWYSRSKSGELIALLGLGCRPARLACAQLPPMLACALPALLLAGWVSGSTQAAPARVLGQLVSAGEVACATGSQPLARIPVGGLVQDCSSGWLIGPLPSGGGWLATQRHRAPALGDSLSKLDLGPTQLFFQTSWVTQGEAVSAVRIDVEQASIAGLPQPVAGRRGLLRGLALLATVAMQALWVGLLGAAGRAVRRAGVGALVSSLVALALLSFLDRSAAAGWTFLALPACVGSCWVLGLASLRWRAPRGQAGDPR